MKPSNTVHCKNDNNIATVPATANKTRFSQTAENNLRCLIKEHNYAVRLRNNKDAVKVITRKSFSLLKPFQRKSGGLSV